MQINETTGKLRYLAFTFNRFFIAFRTVCKKPVDDFRNDYNKFLYDAVNEMQD
jgi:hypothetical protein